MIQFITIYLKPVIESICAISYIIITGPVVCIHTIISFILLLIFVYYKQKPEGQTIHTSTNNFISNKKEGY